jgi:hypothetical protein
MFLVSGLLTVLPSAAGYAPALAVAMLVSVAAPAPVAAAEQEREGPEIEDNGRGEGREREDVEERGRESESEESRVDDDARMGEGLEFEPDVVLAIDLSDEARIRTRAMGFRVVDEDVLHGLGFRLTQLATPGGLPPEVALRKLREADPTGTYDFNPRYVAAGDPPCEGIRCDAQKMVGWPVAGCPAAVRIGMVDTAIARGSPALAGSRIEQQHFGNSGATEAGTEHGTEIATIFAGNADAGFAGLVPHAYLVSANVFDFSADKGESTNAVLIARGVDWVVAQHPSVINMAIAGPDNAVLHETVRRAANGGIPVIAAAGNLGPEGPPRYPAAYPEVIAVTAVDHNGQIYPHANWGDYITVAAPGVHIWSAAADGHGRFVDGTSFATPFVSAAVALMRLADARRTPAEVQLALRKQAVAVAGTENQRAYGAGLLRGLGCAAVAPGASH